MNLVEKTISSFGERLVQHFRREGVTTIFSQGDLSMKDIQKHAALAGVKIVAPRHEASAGFMAMGYYEMTGKAQVAMGAIGPGQANLLPAATAAAQEFTPVIFLGARRQSVIDQAVRRGRWLHAPVFSAFESICKFAAKVDSLTHLDELIQEAFRQATTGTPGPVYIEYDYKLNEQSAAFPALMPIERYRAPAQKAPQDAVEAACAKLLEAKSPVILVGEGIQRAQAQDHLDALATRLGCPVLTSLAGAGAIAETHPNWLRFMSEAGAQALESADVIFSIGTCLPEMMNYGYQRNFASSGNAYFIQSDPDIAAIGVNRPIDLAVIGQTDLVLDQMLTRISENPVREASPYLATWKAQQIAEDAANRDAIPNTNMIHPGRLMVEARAGVPDDAIVVVDGGLTMLYQYALFEKRDLGFLYTGNYSHLGTGLGLAIGAQLATGNKRPVCLVTGDGALGFHIMELETMVRHNLPIVVIVNDDQCLGAEMGEQIAHIGHEIEATFSPVNYADVAKAMGADGYYVEQAEDIAPAINSAFKSGRPCLVQVKTDQAASYAFAPAYIMDLVSWLEEDAATYSTNTTQEQPDE
jgi:thiamine pyrophosphate-dependent acetolactate synthase large subunit-like protein